MNNPALESRILTLVFTDLVGSTALKSKHGDQVAGALVERHREIVRAHAAASGGRVIDWAGDGCFLTFASASTALHFALSVQLAHAEQNDLPSVRIGIHMGEVTEHPFSHGSAQPHVEGLAVDLAARIGALAGSKQILVSGSVAEGARTRLTYADFARPIHWQACGNYALKGIAQPVGVYAVALEGVGNLEPPERDRTAPSVRAPFRVAWQTAGATALAIAIGTILIYFAYQSTTAPEERVSDVERAYAAEPATARREISERPAIAVLPFDNLSPDPEQAYFADGLAEDLITRLSTWRAFPVVARNSSFQYRGGNLNLITVGRDLGARYLVEGSVRRSEDRIRVTAQLVDANSGEHLWAETFDRAVDDVFALQDEISNVLAASLIDDLTRAEGERARQRGTQDLEAWELYHLGLQHFDRYTLEGFGEARELFSRAAKHDARFATAYGNFAVAAITEVMLGRAGPHESFIENAMEQARKAVQLDPRDPVAHLGVGVAYVAQKETRSALDAIQRAIDLNPSMPGAWIWMGFTRILSGDPEGAISATKRAQRLNPKGNMVWILDNFALAYWELGRYEDALEAARRLAATEPSYFPAYAYLAMNYVALDRLDEAIEAVAEGRQRQPDLSLELVQDYLGVERPEIDARRNAALRRAGLQ